MTNFREFTKEAYGKEADKFTFKMEASDAVREHIKWLVEEKGCSITTRNYRLIVIKQYI